MSNVWKLPPQAVAMRNNGSGSSHIKSVVPLVKKPPNAPQVYRPQPIPKVLQRAVKPVPPPSATLPPRVAPAAPAPYRPQPTPKVLQRKPEPLRPGLTAAPVYRPQSAPVVQPRNVDTGQRLILKPGLPRPTAPPVYRPQPLPRVLQPRLTIAGLRSTVQRTAVHAAEYIEDHGLKITLKIKKYVKNDPEAVKGSTRKKTVTRSDVENFVKDTKNLAARRLGLLTAWNKEQQNRWKIGLPKDLKPSKVPSFTTSFNFTEHDSDDDDLMDIDETIEQSKSGEMTLYRPSMKTEEKAPILSFEASIRTVRQIVKRELYKEYLPIVMKIGDNYLELKPPGTLDVYCTPLEEVSKGQHKGKYRRTGTSSDFNWATLARQLDRETEDDKDRPRKKRRIFGTFQGESHEKMTPSEIEAIGAITCDYMKGSGTSEFVYKVINDKENRLFSEIFSEGWYKPAITGGRKIVRETTLARKIKKGANL